jgi:hypothetical protein
VLLFVRFLDQRCFLDSWLGTGSGGFVCFFGFGSCFELLRFDDTYRLIDELARLTSFILIWLTEPESGW